VDRKIMRLVLDGYGVREAESGNAMAAAAKKKGSPLHMDRWMAGQDGARAVLSPAFTGLLSDRPLLFYPCSR
jgi:hypothetical protein